jgi:AhpD family alkylhydroperoxidase
MNDFDSERERLNKLVLDNADLVTKRFFALDTSAYQEGALNAKTKEMLGLVASMVLRCDDCIRYHLNQCHKLGVTDAEAREVFSIALVVGGSIVIPHLRRAEEFWQSLTPS